jgi:hypothetical protein
VANPNWSLGRNLKFCQMGRMIRKIMENLKKYTQNVEKSLILVWAAENYFWPSLP